MENRGPNTKTVIASIEVFTLDRDHPDYLSDPVAAHLVGDPVFFYGDCIPAETAAFIQRQRVRFPIQPILVTEFGHWSDSDGGGEPYQVQTADETLDGLFPFAAVHPEGNTTSGPLCGVTWWGQFNWYRVQEPHKQTMGLMHMDRVTVKPVYSTLRERYRPYFDMCGLGEAV